MNPNYYAIIPAGVRYSVMKPNAKLLYGEITALANKKGYCFATNKYFAELYSVNKNTISLWIKELKEFGFIEVDLIYKDKQVIERRIGITNINEGYHDKTDEGITKKQKVNITSINTTSSSIIKRRIKFEDIVLKIIDIDKNTLKDFINYWTETNHTKTKMKFEMEKTFDINLRVKRWESNNKKWNKTSTKSKVLTVFDSHNNVKEMIRKLNNK
tara:strand:- start:456 stop:1097 length:642 start_codon:yes stop_codon:yes gene_type:complete